MTSFKASEAHLGLFWRMLVLVAILLFAATSLFADSPAVAQTVTLRLKSYEGDVSDAKFMFYITSTEVPEDTGDWHPGMVDKSYKVGDTIGSFKIIKFVPLESKSTTENWGGTDKSVLILINPAKPSVKVVLPVGKDVTVPLK